MTDNRSSPGSATSPIGQSDVEMLRHLADSLGFGRTHDMLRRVIAACPYLTVDAAQSSQEPVAFIVLSEETGNTRIWWQDKARADAWCAEHGKAYTPLYAVPPSPVAGERVDRLEDERNRLQNSYGSGPFADGLITRRIAEIDKELSSSPPPPETTRNLAESICDDCPPAGSIEGTRCLVCPRTSSVSSTTRGPAA